LPLRRSRNDKVPKYYLLFGSRAVEGLELMNDSMAKARGESSLQTDLFSEHELRDHVLRGAARPIARGKLILDVIRRAFCVYHRTEIRRMIGELLRDGTLEAPGLK